MVRVSLCAGLALAMLLQIRSAVADDRNLLGLPEQAARTGGSLVICGGGDLPEEIYQEFISLAGGEGARLVIIPTAYPFPDMSYAKRAYGGWYDEDVKSVKFLDAKSREEADTDDFIQPLQRATGVWISGGMQGRLSDTYANTKVELAIKEVLNRGGVVGGTSAGAASMSRVMIRYGTPSNAHLGQGLGLLQNAIVDQHFLARKRLPRLIGALSQYPSLVGIGVDEGTAVIVRQNRVRVVGDSDAVVCMGQTANRSAAMIRLKPGTEVELQAKNRDEKGALAAISLLRLASN